MMDFDGTLSPLRRHPSEAKISREAVRVLKDILSKTEDVSVAVISGRALRDIRRRVGIKGIVYAGNHGLEIEGPGISFVEPKAERARAVIKEINGKLKKGYRSVKGVVVEDKGLSISVHFRMVKQRPAQRIVEETLEDITASYRAAGKIVMMKGKKVLEVKPPSKWNKGDAVLRIIREDKKISGKEILPVYIGDDRTDEDAFRAVEGVGIGIFVAGNKRSRAPYYLKGPREVLTFLKKTAKIKKTGKNGKTS
jgi:trehalose-phosphatase